MVKLQRPVNLNIHALFGIPKFSTRTLTNQKCPFVAVDKVEYNFSSSKMVKKKTAILIINRIYK